MHPPPMSYSSTGVIKSTSTAGSEPPTMVVHQNFSKVMLILEFLHLHSIYVHNDLDDTANVYYP